MGGEGSTLSVDNSRPDDAQIRPPKPQHTEIQAQRPSVREDDELPPLRDHDFKKSGYRWWLFVVVNVVAVIVLSFIFGLLLHLVDHEVQPVTHPPPPPRPLGW
jgi:hypothetical protein